MTDFKPARMRDGSLYNGTDRLAKYRDASGRITCPPIDHKEAVALYLSGMTMANVGKALGCSKTHVRKILDTNGVAVSSGGNAAKSRTLSAQAKNLTQESLISLLSYDKDTGIFRWRQRLSIRALPGAEAGAVSHGYVIIGIGGRFYRAHRLAWLYVHGKWPTLTIDHINGNRADNRIANLRDVNRQANSQNTRKAFASNKSSGLLGVSYHKQSGLWHACIVANGVTHSLKYHKTPELAHAAYLKAKRKLHEGCTI